MSGIDATHCQVAPLQGRIALHTAVVGGMMIGAGAFMAWMQWSEPWPLVAFSTVVSLPVLTLGVYVLGLAALFHYRQAEWHLSADAAGVTLETRTAGGRVVRFEAMPVCRMQKLTWVAGDADIAAGLRFEARTGRDLFIPATSFDCAALAAFALRAYPGDATSTLLEEMQAV